VSRTANARSLARVPVLIVEDLELDAKLHRILLEQEGCEVRIATSVAEAVPLVESFRPRVLLVAVRWPGTDDRPLIQILEIDERRRDTVLIAVTAFGGEAAAKAAGYDGFIAKPIDVERFADTIHSHLRGGSE
jgi:two-component system CheB/CheR fusion protein